MGVATLSKQDMGQEALRNSLEERLNFITVITNENILRKEKLRRYFFRILEAKPNENLSAAFDIAYDYHTTGGYTLRDSGDPYLVHPLQTAFVIKNIGIDTLAQAAGLLHDVPENNREREKEIFLRIKNEVNPEIVKLLYLITPPKIDDPVLKKYLVFQQIIRSAEEDYQFRGHGLRVADRLTNLLSLHSLKPKKDRTAEERRDNIINDTKRHVLPLAAAIDRVYYPTISFYDYVDDLIMDYEIARNNKNAKEPELKPVWHLKEAFSYS